MSESINGKLYRLEIMQDTDAESPRDYDNLGTIISWHRDGYSDIKPTEDSGQWVAKHMREDDLVGMLPVYLMDHSGVSISVYKEMFKAFDQQGWDWGQIGFIYVERSKAEEWCPGLSQEDMMNPVADVLEKEVELYNQYLQGDVWGFVLYKMIDVWTKGQVPGDDPYAHMEEEVDSCFGFYGSNPLTNGMLDSIPDDARVDLFGEDWETKVKIAVYNERIGYR